MIDTGVAYENYEEPSVPIDKSGKFTGGAVFSMASAFQAVDDCFGIFMWTISWACYCLSALKYAFGFIEMTSISLDLQSSNRLLFKHLTKNLS